MLSVLFTAAVISTQLPQGCSDAQLGQAYGVIDQALQQEAYADIPPIVEDLVAACGTHEATYYARYIGGLLAAERGDIDQVLGLMNALPVHEPEYFDPAVNWAIINAYAAREDWTSFTRERDRFRDSWISMTELDDEGGRRGEHVETIDHNGARLDAIALDRSHPEWMQRYIFLYTRGDRSPLRAVTVGGYAGTRSVSAELRGVDPSTLWHVDGYDCAGHATLGFLETDTPSYSDMLAIALEMIGDNADPDTDAASGGCAFTHLITPYVFGAQ